MSPGETAFTVHATFLGKESLCVERAMRMICSFNDPLKECIFDDKVLMIGTVVGSTPQGVAHRVKDELEGVGASGLLLLVEERDEPYTQGWQGNQEAAQEAA